MHFLPGDNNVALGKKAIQSSQFHSQRPVLAVDGRLDTTMHSAVTDTPKWWQVDLEVSHFLTHTIVYNTIPGISFLTLMLLQNSSTVENAGV